MADLLYGCDRCIKYSLYFKYNTEDRRIRKRRGVTIVVTIIAPGPSYKTSMSNNANPNKLLTYKYVVIKEGGTFLIGPEERYEQEDDDHLTGALHTARQ